MTVQWVLYHLVASRLSSDLT